MVQIFYEDGSSFFSCPFIYTPPPAKRAQLTIYPNPVQHNSTFYVELDPETAEADLNKMKIEITSSTGQLLKTVIPTSALMEIDLHVAPAVYVVKVTDAKGEVKTYKLVVN